jgi:hypothetical protein
MKRWLNWVLFWPVLFARVVTGPPRERRDVKEVKIPDRQKFMAWLIEAVPDDTMWVIGHVSCRETWQNLLPYRVHRGPDEPANALDVLINQQTRPELVRLLPQLGHDLGFQCFYRVRELLMEGCENLDEAWLGERLYQPAIDAGVVR